MRKIIGRFARKHMMGLYKIYEKIFWNIVGKRKNKGLHTLGYKYLNKMTEVLDESGLCYFITYGTLLGMIREGGFLGHDEDIDIGVICDDQFSWERIEDAMKKIGMNKKHQFRLNGEVTEQTYAVDTLSVDFFLFYEKDEEHHIAYAYFRKPDKIYENNDFEVSQNIVSKIKRIKKIENKEGCFNIPENAEKFLEDVYGKSWRIPDPNWIEDMDVVKNQIGFIEYGKM